MLCIGCAPSLAWTHGSQPVYVGPCDILATAGTPCVAAHSVIRKMFAAYSGPLFQIIRTSDSTTLDVSAGTNGKAILSPTTAFCAATVCNYNNIYDQAHTGSPNNNLPNANAGNPAPLSSDTFPKGTTLPILSTSCTNPCSVVGGGTLGQIYRNRSSTTGIPTSANPITVYYVRTNTQSSICCGDYGDMENPVSNHGAGTMFALVYTTLNGTPAQVGIDREGDDFTFATTVPTRYALLAKHGSGNTAIKIGDATTGGLTTLYNSVDPVTFNLEGGISIGEGGDGTPALTNWYEGAIIAAATADATDVLLQANIVSFYGPL